MSIKGHMRNLVVMEMLYILTVSMSVFLVVIITIVLQDVTIRGKLRKAKW